MDDSKTKVCSIRFAPATWERVKRRADELGMTAQKLVELATRSALGEPVSDRYKAVGEAFGQR